MTNLIGMGDRAIASAVEEAVDRGYQGRQVAHWVIHRNARSFSEMTDLPLAIRARLGERFTLTDPEVERRLVSFDGAVKLLLRLADGSRVEGVVMPEARKLTLCLSSQTGCAVGCTFCVTGLLGSGRNLTPAELVGQYRVMLREVEGEPERVNLVFMGMGEPLLNLGNLEVALNAIFARVSPRRITVSTCGIVPGIEALGAWPRRPKLAVSLNAVDDERRSVIMPITARYPLADLMAALRRFPLERGRRITFEYVLIRGFNDRTGDAAALARLLRGIPCKINVIPFNEDALLEPALQQPTPVEVNAFAGSVRERGLTVTVRWSRGRDVGAACGQLKGQGSGVRTMTDN